MGNMVMLEAPKARLAEVGAGGNSGVVPLGGVSFEAETNTVTVLTNDKHIRSALLSFLLSTEKFCFSDSF